MKVNRLLLLAALLGFALVAHADNGTQWLTYPGGDGPGKGKQARVFHPTMGSAHDLQSAGLRRLTINAAYWGMGLESAIIPTRSVDIVGTYQPLDSGFNYKQLGVVPKPVSAYR